jgi:hypothetical protein
MITVWWLQKLGKDWQQVNKKHRRFMGKKFKLGKLNELEFRKQHKIVISYRLQESLCFN